MKLTRIQSVLALAIFGLSATASADVTFGGARAAGMGGAGLALPIDVGNNYRMNPAFLGCGSKRPVFSWPSIGYKLDGISYSGVNDVIGSIDKGGLDANSILTLARRYANSDKAVAFNGNAGFRFGGLAIGATGEAGVNSVPNAALQTWAQNGGDVNNVPANGRLDAYGFGYQQFEVGYGNSVRSNSGKVTVGMNMREIKAYYAHKFADGTTIQSNNGNGVQNGSGITGDFVSKTGTGMDLGVLYNFPGNNDLYLGTVIQNFVEPNIAFNYEAPGGGNPIVPGGFDPFKRTFNVGMGYVKNNLLLAADWVDLGNHAGGQQFRAGAEVGLTKTIFIRAGYNTATNTTYGVSINGLNIQLGGRVPLSITSVIRF